VVKGRKLLFFLTPSPEAAKENREPPMNAD